MYMRQQLMRCDVGAPEVTRVGNFHGVGFFNVTLHQLLPGVHEIISAATLNHLCSNPSDFPDLGSKM